MDAESEYLVQEALDRLMKGRTVITIAHRLSTIMNADTIFVLDKGSICEYGSYSQLMLNADGLFRKLVEKQTFVASKNNSNDSRQSEVLSLSSTPGFTNL